ncbi:hypothetical protein [Streptomyces europaeiscabiei]|uniref:hypothetical protein n=1 Tax=Streptomyces europaeiscabiei TaxID=146819 RepID=UPI002E0D3AFB|nr:hypothetical protein OHB30_50890 [Streptomyces europaeiscabiei]
MSSNQRDVDHALAYPEPPASPLWHRHGGVKARPLTDAQKRRNRELLDIAQRTTRPRSPRPTESLAEAS